MYYLYLNQGPIIVRYFYNLHQIKDINYVTHFCLKIDMYIACVEAYS